MRDDALPGVVQDLAERCGPLRQRIVEERGELRRADVGGDRLLPDGFEVAPDPGQEFLTVRFEFAGSQSPTEGSC